LRIVKAGLFGLAGLAAMVLAVILVRAAIDAPTAADPAPFIAKAAEYDATIKRDEWGVPHIFGDRDADAAFGIGYAHAEDDFGTIQEVLIATRGHLASIKGERAAVTDYLVNLMGVWETVNKRYESDLSPEVREVIEAYADGVNYYAALHPENVVPGTLPVTGEDIAAGFIFKSPFFYGLDKVLLAVFEGKVGGETGLSKEGVDAFLPSERARQALPARRMARPGFSSIRISPSPARSPGMKPSSKAGKAGTLRADSSPALPSCCMATMQRSAGQTP